MVVGIGTPNPFFRLGPGTVLPLEAWKRSRQQVSSHRVTATSSQGTQLLSTRASRAGQIMLQRRTSPRSLTSCYNAQEGVSFCLFDTLYELQSYFASWAWAMLCCPSLLASPRSNRMEVRSAGSSGTSFGRTSTPQCPSLSGLYCYDCKTASDSSGFTAPRSGSSTWPTHSTTYRSVRLSDSSCAERSALGSSSSKSSAWGESRHPISGAGFQRPLVAWFGLQRQRVSLRDLRG